MELIHCTKNDIKKYIKFCKNIYKGDLYFRDSMTPILKGILYGTSSFVKDAEITPIMAVNRRNEHQIAAVCTLIHVKRMPDVLQMAFFEARENCQEAVDSIIEKAKEICKIKGIKKIVVGLNGHVNYGLGMLADNFNQNATFGTAYNPPYYVDYFKKYDPEEYTLTSFVTDMDKFDLNMEQRILKRVNRKFTFRKADFKNLQKEVEIYTSLNNKSFQNHAFYYDRTFEEDYELFKDFKLFLREENFLIAEKDGVPVGFMLWYPDFNQLIPPGGTMGLKAFIKNKFLGHKITKFKIAELGIVPEYQGCGVSVGLFEKCMQFTKDRYQWCEAGWILDSNIRSKGFGLKWADQEYKRYKVFQICL